MTHYVNPSSVYTGTISGIINQGSPAHLIGQSRSISKTADSVLTISAIKRSIHNAWNNIAGKITDDPALKAEFKKVMDLIEQLISAQSTLFDYKGSVETVNDLPTEGKVGDCYNVLSNGANYAWNGNSWDKLSETVDLSAYLTVSEFNTLIDNLATKTSVTELQEALNSYKTEVNTTINDILSSIETTNGRIDTLTTTVENHIEDSKAHASKVALESEEAARINADTQLQNNIDSLSSDLQDHISDAEAHMATKVDLEGYYDKDEIDTFLNNKEDKSTTTTINNKIDTLETKVDNHIENAANTLNNNYYNKTDIDGLLNNKANTSTVEQSFSDLRAELNDAFQEIDGSIAGVQDEIVKKANSSDVTSLVEQEVSNRETAISNLSNSVDTKLEDKADKTDLDDYYNKSETDTKVNKKVDKELTGNYGKAIIFNEEDGGGAKFESNSGRWSFAGVNDMADANGLGVQLYNIDRNNNNVGPRINLTADRATYSIQKTEVGEEYELVVKKDIQSLNSDLTDFITDNYYTGSKVDELLLSETESRTSADETLDTKIDTVKTEIETELEDCYKKTETYNKTEIDNKDTDTEKRVLGRIWSNVNSPENGYFTTKYKHNNNSYALLFNESDGGGSQYFNSLANTISYVGTNNGGTSSSDINVQLYSLDNDTKSGTRLNVNTQGIFYVKGAKGQGNPEGRELAVKADITSLSSTIETALETINTKLESIFHYKGSVANIDSLPNDNEVGDVYNIESDGHNVAWNGGSWDKLSETIDLTPYLTTESFNTIIADYYDKVEARDKMMEISDAAELRILGRIWSSVDIEDDTVGNFQVGDLQVIDDKAYYGGTEPSNEIATKGDLSVVSGDLSTLTSTVEGISNTYVTQTNLSNTIDNYYTKTQSDERYLQEHQDISSKAEQSALETEITNRTSGDNAIISKIWSNNNLNTGHFYTKLTNNKGGYALVFNESDGGGSQVYDKTDDVISYVGTNLEEGEGAENGVNVQIYSKNKTTNEGVRINVNTQKAYYLKGANVPNPAERELAVVADITNLQQQIDSVDGSAVTNEEFAELQEEVDTKAEQADLETVDGKIAALVNQMLSLEAKYNEVRLSNVEIISVYDDDNNYFEDGEKDYILSGQVEAPLNLTAKSVTLRDMGINASVVNAYTTGDFNMSGTEIDGEYDKNTMGNTIMSIHSDSYVTIRDCTITPETSYNGLEIGLTTGLTKGVIIDNVDFDGVFTNNAISIFGTADNAIITISNCHFHQVSNLLRLSNRANNRCTINLINCTCDTWETGTYAGPIICQDYTSQGQGNLFAPDKITINIQNLIGPNGKIVSGNPEDLFGCKNNNQVCYVYVDGTGFIDYDATKYPTINIQ